MVVQTLCLLILLLPPASAGSDGPLVIPSNQAQLFLDDRLIESSDRLFRTVHRPEMYSGNPVIDHDQPWEFDCVTLWGSILYDEEEQKFKAWYQTWGDIVPGRVSIFVCYAESTDGIKWTKPNLGLVSYNGSKQNNIVVAPIDVWLDSPTVVKDMNDPDPNQRYKMALHESGPNHPPHWGIWHMTSPDGIHWTRMKTKAVDAGDRNSLFHDPLRNKWVVITRKPGIDERTIAFAEGDKFGDYGPMRVVFQKDKRDPPKSDLYSMPTFAYEGMLIGLPEVYNHDTRREVTQLAWSYDGDTWHRDPERQPFLLWGREPAWDWARRTPHNGPMIERDGKLWFYFGGRSTLKMTTNPRRLVGAIGLAFLRIDGFCSRDASPDGGSLTTRRLVLQGSQLTVNARIRTGASLRVAVLDENGAPVPGFDESQVVPVTGDNTAHVIRWKNRADVQSVTGKAVRLKFSFNNGELYSFRVK